ncbi:MAG: alpha/beta hydrolase, partial [Sciscionella sp.]
ALLSRTRRVVRTPPSELSQGLHASTLCADGDWPWRAGADLAHRKRRLAAAAAHLDPAAVWPFDVRTAVGNGIVQTCLRWPAGTGPPSGTHRMLPDVPTLLLGGGRDLSTPVEWLREEARFVPHPQVRIVASAVHSLQSHARSDAGRQAVVRFLRARG